MRKDVKLGLAVGGVLLAVLVVYVLVVPGNNGNQPGAEVSMSDGSESGNGGATVQGAAGGTDSIASAGPDAAQADAGAKNQQAKSSEGSTADAGATAGAVKTGDGSGTSVNGGTGTTGGEKPTADTGGWNWDALVSGAEKVPSLGAATDVHASGGALSNNSTGASGSNGTGASDLASRGDASGAPGATDATLRAPVGNQLSGTAAGASQAESASHKTTGSANGIAGAAQGAADATSTTAQPPTGAQEHVVKDGETYSKISQAIYGSSKYYAQIEKANPNIDPTRLKPGMKITIPPLDTVKSTGTGGAAVAAAEKAIDPKSEYKVQPNDNLYTISMRLYGKADRVEKIYELNKPTIGDDMARLKVGMILKLPEAPTQGGASGQGTIATSAR